jgi:hypothetical protein
MKPYLYGSRERFHIIDLDKTATHLKVQYYVYGCRLVATGGMAAPSPHKFHNVIIANRIGTSIFCFKVWTEY